MPTPVRNRPSLYRRDTAPVLEGPDYANMYARFGEQSRLMHMYGERVRRTRMQDFQDLTKVNMNANITHEALNKRQMDAYGKYRSLTTDFVEKYGMTMGPEQVMKIQEAQAELLNEQTKLADVNTRYDYSRKMMFDNPGVYIEKHFNDAVKEMKAGGFPASFLKIASVDPVAYLGEQARGITPLTHTRDVERGDVTEETRYKQRDLTPEEIDGIIETNYRRNKAFKGGVLEDWADLTNTERANSDNDPEKWAMENPEYREPFERKTDILYKREEDDGRGGGGKPTETAFTYDPVNKWWNVSGRKEGKGIPLASITVGEDTFRDVTITHLQPQDDIAYITVPKDAQKTYKELKAEGYDPKLLEYSIIMNGIDTKEKKSTMKLKKIAIPYEDVKYVIKDANVTLGPMGEGSGYEY